MVSMDGLRLKSTVTMAEVAIWPSSALFFNALTAEAIMPAAVELRMIRDI